MLVSLGVRLRKCWLKISVPIHLNVTGSLNLDVCLLFVELSAPVRATGIQGSGARTAISGNDNFSECVKIKSSNDVL